MKKLVSLTQREVIDFSLESLYYNRQVYNRLEVGMGKTITSLEIAREVIGENTDKRVLFISRGGVLPQSEKANNEYMLEQGFNLKIDYKSYGYFQDLEFLKTQMSLANQYGLVIVDEAHYIKSYSDSILSQAEKPLDYFIEYKDYIDRANANSEKRKLKFPYTLVSIGVLAFIKNIKYRVFMSGTAMPLGAVDIFNFLWLGKHKKLISNPYSRQESYFDFCNKYCIKKQTPNGVSYSGFKGLKDTSENSAYLKLLKNLSDCYIDRKHVDEKSVHLRIPDPIYTQIQIEDDEKNYLEEERIIEVLRKHYNVNSENFLQILKTTPQFAQMMVLRRAVGISKVTKILKHDKKIGKKAIYFFQFKEASQIFFNAISKKHENCYHITGELSIKKTAKIIEHANALDECIMVATMGKAGTGFDCNGFSTIAFCELDMNFALVEQARGRILRKGIKHTPRIFFFLTPGGVDEMVVNNLLSKNFKSLSKAG